jgi:hypothetical protein
MAQADAVKGRARIAYFICASLLAGAAPCRAEPWVSGLSEPGAWTRCLRDGVSARAALRRASVRGFERGNAVGRGARDRRAETCAEYPRPLPCVAPARP